MRNKFYSFLLLILWYRKSQNLLNMMKFGFVKCRAQLHLAKISLFGSMTFLLIIMIWLTSSAIVAYKLCSLQAQLWLRNGANSLTGFWIGWMLNSKLFLIWLEKKKKLWITTLESIYFKGFLVSKDIQLQYWFFVVIQIEVYKMQKAEK